MPPPPDDNEVNRLGLGAWFEIGAAGSPECPTKIIVCTINPIQL